MTSEEIVIGALISGDCHEKIPSLKADFFENHGYRVIAQTIKELHSFNQPIDPATVSKKANVKFSVLADLANSYIPSLDVIKHIDRIKEAGRRREYIDMLQNNIKRIKAGEDIDDVMASALVAETSTKLEKNVHSVDDLIESYHDRIRDVRTGGMFTTGIQRIDQQIRGVAKGETMFFLGRPGTFKTATMQFWFRNHIQDSNDVAIIFSLEMPGASILERYMQMSSGLSGRDVENLFLRSSDQAIDICSRCRVEYEKLYVVDAKTSLEQIPEYIKIVEKRSNKKVGLIGIDYIGIVDCKYDKEYERIGYVARGCKILAKLTRLPVIALCQTNRAASDGSQELFLHHGRGSGEIEEAADFIIGSFHETPDPDSDIIFKILKNRKGPTNSCWRIELDKQCFSFGPDSFPWEPPSQKKRTSFE